MVGCREHLIYEQRGEELAIYRAQCKCWHCDNCAPWLREQTAERIKDGYPVAFATFTYRATRDGTADEHARELVTAWQVLRKRIDRLIAPRKLEFAAVMERTKRGEPHLHLAIRAPKIEQAWLSDQMAELIDSPVVHIKAIRGTAQAARYMVKYMTKDPHRFTGCKRFWFSKGYDLSADDDAGKRISPDVQGQWKDTTLEQVKEAAGILGIAIVKSVSSRLVLHACDIERLRGYIETLARSRAPPRADRLAAGSSAAHEPGFVSN